MSHCPVSPFWQHFLIWGAMPKGPRHNRGRVGQGTGKERQNPVQIWGSLGVTHSRHHLCPCPWETAVSEVAMIYHPQRLPPKMASFHPSFPSCEEHRA